MLISAYILTTSRFKGMSTLFVSSSGEAEALAGSLGMGMIPELRLTADSSKRRLASPDAFANDALKSLGESHNGNSLPEARSLLPTMRANASHMDSPSVWPR